MGVEIETITPGDGKTRACAQIERRRACLFEYPSLYGFFTGRTFPKKGQTCVVHYVGEFFKLILDMGFLLRGSPEDRSEQKRFREGGRPETWPKMVTL